MKKIFTLFIFTSLATTFFAQPKKVVLVEEGTGTWCQWCPRGEVYSKILAKDYPDDALFVAVHEGDPMEDTDYWEATGLIGLPSANIDRTFESNLDPFTDLPNDMSQQLALIPPAGISVSETWNAVTREMTMTVTADFESDLSGDYRLAAIVVEDGVTGTSLAYDQSNAYSTGTIPMDGYESMSNPVPASLMVYNHVGRHLPGGYQGNPNSLPTNISAGDSHSYSYDWVLPNDYNEEYVYVIGILVNAANGQVLNAGRSNYLPGFANGKPFFHSTPKLQGFVGLHYEYGVLVHDPDHDDLMITNISGLPAGLTLTDLEDGQAYLGGIPTTQGVFEITLNASDGVWNIEQTYELIIGQAEEDWLQVGIPGFSDSEADDIDIEIDGHGEIYVMATDNNKVLLYHFKNGAWVQIGATLNGDSFHSGMAIAPDNTPYIYSGGVVSKLVDEQWEQVGSYLPGGQYIFADIIIDPNGTPFVVHFTPPSSTNAYFYNGSNWELAGSMTDGVAVWNRLHLDDQGNPIIIYGTDGSSIAYSEVAQWDGSAWNLLGDNYIEPNSQTYFDHDVVVTLNGDIFAALTIGVGIQQLNIYQLNGGNWDLIAEDIAGGGTESCNLKSDADGNLIVAFRDESEGGRTSVMKYDGSEWNYMGLPGFTNIAAIQSLTLDLDGIPYVAYRDANEGGKVSVKKFEDLSNGIFTPTVADYRLNIFPNPNSGQFILEFEKGENYQIVNISGQLIAQGDLNPSYSNNGLNYQNIEMPEMPNGLYFVKVIGEHGIQTVKFMKG